MTTPTRLAPVRRAVRRPPSPVRAPVPPRRRPPAQRKPVSFERVLLWSLLLSAAAHLVILLVSPLFIGVGVPPGTTAAGDPAAEPVAMGMRAIVPVASDGAEPEEPVRAAQPAERSPEASRERATPERSPRPAPAAAGGAAAGTETGRRTVSEALRPGYSDGRLWVNPRALRLERAPSRQQAYMEHLHARIEAMNDSIYGRGPDTDWTYTDDEGRRWGISEEGVHLGGITIPRQLLPIPHTGTNQEQEENRERARQREEIIRQEAERVREEAAEESRRAAERRRRDGGGGPDGGG